MKLLRKLAWIILLTVAVLSAMASVLSTSGYATQFREEPSAAPSRQHWLGTDELGRDRFARLLYGTRISLGLAPVAALLATALAAAIGGGAGYLGGRWQRGMTVMIDLFLCLPWLFLLVIARAMLPLNVSPMVSVLVTFGLLGALGWAGPARVVAASVAALRDSECVLQARAVGTTEWRILLRHILPRLLPILSAQFLILVPVFVLSEANLGMLGLGVAEPLPSWGSLLREMESLYGLTSAPWRLVPLGLLMLVVNSLQLVMGDEETSA